MSFGPKIKKKKKIVVLSFLQIKAFSVGLGSLPLRAPRPIEEVCRTGASSDQTLAHGSEASERDARTSPWLQQPEKPAEAFSKGSTGSSCAGTQSTSPSSSPAPSSVSGPWIMEFTNCGSTTTLGNGMKTFQFWGKGHRKNELSTLSSFTLS